MTDLENRINHYAYAEIIKLYELSNDFSAGEITKLISQSMIKHYQLDLYYRPKHTRFGELGPTAQDILTFIFKNYPHTFIGGHYLYNGWGFSQQVPNLMTLWSNQATEINHYEFKLIEIEAYAPPINPEYRKIYPFLELMKNDNCFWDDDYRLNTEEKAQLQQNKLNNFVSQLNPAEKVELRMIADKFYSTQVVEIIKKLLREK